MRLIRIRFAPAPFHGLLQYFQLQQGRSKLAIYVAIGYPIYVAIGYPIYVAIGYPIYVAIVYNCPQFMKILKNLANLG